MPRTDGRHFQGWLARDGRTGLIVPAGKGPNWAREATDPTDMWACWFHRVPVKLVAGLAHRLDYVRDMRPPANRQRVARYDGDGRLKGE